jgi:hypothetical protein
LQDDTEYNIGQLGKIAFGINWTGNMLDTTLTSKVLSFHCLDFEMYQGDNTGTPSNYTTSICSSLTFPASNWTNAIEHAVDESTCIDPTELILQGDPYSDNFKYIYAAVGPCTDASIPCGLEADISSEVEDKTLKLQFLSGYYNHSSIDPIRDTIQYIEIKTYYGYHIEWHQYIKENIVNFINGTTQTFYSLSRRTEFMRATNEVSFSI